MIPSSACPQRRADQPGNAGQHGDQCRQLHHPMGHHQGARPVSCGVTTPNGVCGMFAPALVSATQSRFFGSGAAGGTQRPPFAVCWGQSGRAGRPVRSFFETAAGSCLACGDFGRSGRVASFQRIERQPGRSRQHLMNFMPAPAPPARRPAHAQRPTAHRSCVGFYHMCDGPGDFTPRACGGVLVARSRGGAVAPAGEAPGMARQIVQRPFERLEPQGKPRAIDRIAGRRPRRDRRRLSVIFRGMRTLFEG